VVVCPARDGQRRPTLPGFGNVVVAKSGARGDEVEDLDNLGAEASLEPLVSAEGVLCGDPALLVRGGAQREPGLA
jgi:hypothetical protein